MKGTEDSKENISSTKAYAMVSWTPGSRNSQEDPRCQIKQSFSDARLGKCLLHFQVSRLLLLSLSGENSSQSTEMKLAFGEFYSFTYITNYCKTSSLKQL